MEVITKSKTLSVILVVFLCTLFLRLFVVEGFVVRGDSMLPTINSGEYVFINKLAYIGDREPLRGDIVVTLPREHSSKIIKRIVGLPRERFYIENGKVFISEDRTDSGDALLETYLNSNNTPSVGTVLIQLDPEEYFALGDNREFSIDSRELGPIDKWDIKGRVIGVFNLKTLKYTKF